MLRGAAGEARRRARAGATGRRPLLPSPPRLARPSRRRHRCLPDRNFRRWNLSEFSHPSKFNRLTGGDPNYVGYKEGGERTNFIRQAEGRRAQRKGGAGTEHTSCVILFDEASADAWRHLAPPLKMLLRAPSAPACRWTARPTGCSPS